jgi:hypothetical protein
MAGLAGHISHADREHIARQKQLIRDRLCYICETRNHPLTIRINHLGMDAWICTECINISPSEEKEKLSRRKK